MITVSFQKDKGQHYKAFLAQGHASYAPEGEADIICAGVTALATGLIGSLHDLLQVKISYVTEEGNIACRIEEKIEDQVLLEKIDLLFSSFSLACKQISISYGKEYLLVNEE